MDYRVCRLLLALALLATFVTPRSGWAQGYPNRAVRLVVPFPAGGPADAGGTHPIYVVTAKQIRERGYRTAGFACGDGAVPLLKPIVAREGDLVEATPKGIKVNGALLPQTVPLPSDSHSRSLKPWPFGVYRVQGGSVWVASSYNRGSYDSRYMGPIATSQIRRRLRALWVL